MKIPITNSENSQQSTYFFSGHYTVGAGLLVVMVEVLFYFCFVRFLWVFFFLMLQKPEITMLLSLPFYLSESYPSSAATYGKFPSFSAILCGPSQVDRGEDLSRFREPPVSVVLLGAPSPSGTEVAV